MSNVSEPDQTAPYVPTPEEIEEAAKRIRTQGFVNKYGQRFEPWGLKWENEDSDDDFTA